MDNVINEYVERRFLQNRQEQPDLRSGFERRTPLQRLVDLRHRKDRRVGDRRKHCMHCGMPYKLDLTGARACICRTIALHGSP